jgi:glycosyltransferase involved in cell wall biosynthesis
MPRIGFIGTLLFWVKIFLKIRIIKPDIVHAQDLWMGTPAFLARKILKIPYIVWGQGNDVYHPNNLCRITTKPILQNAYAILALTENMRIKLNNIFNSEIYVVPNGIDLEEYNDVTQNPERKPGTKNILFVGSLYPVKGVQYLITAMKKIHEDIPDARLILVGDGVERERLVALSIQLGIQKYVQFVGKVPHKEVQTFMQQADVFVLPSLSEGFGIVILEAMACGLPIVATRVGGIPEVIKNDINGYLVEPKRPDEIAEKILILLQNDQLRNEISRTNVAAVKAYAWENIVDQLEYVYKDKKKANFS